MCVLEEGGDAVTNLEALCENSSDGFEELDFLRRQSTYDKLLETIVNPDNSRSM